MAYERVSDPLAPRAVFIRRMAGNVGLALLVVAASLFAGMCGYHAFEGDRWLDAFAEAAMILSGMGPLSPLHTSAGKLFAGMYALYSGLLLVATASFILTPLLHRLMHSLHLAEEDEGEDDAPARVVRRAARSCRDDSRPPGQH